MQIPREQILDLLRSRGHNIQADRADTELPAQVDTEQDQGLLSKFGVDPQDLLGGLGGKSVSEIPWPYPGPPRRGRIWPGSAELVLAWCA